MLGVDNLRSCDIAECNFVILSNIKSALIYRLRRHRSVYDNSTVLLDPENVGVAAGISLLSLLQAEI